MDNIGYLKVDKIDLEKKVKKVYRDVALNPKGKFHFEMGRELAERLGYSKQDLDKIPKAAIESFSGSGFFFDMADLKRGEQVLDLGSGSGMDVFVAALKVGSTGKVCGVDFTDEQLTKANTLSKAYKFNHIHFQKSHIQKLPFEDGSFDVVISNGVINLCPDKEIVFEEVYRVLKGKGRLTISDIVTEKQLPDDIVCSATLWASCIGGASQLNDYFKMIERAGMNLTWLRENGAYSFLSKSAIEASKKYGVKSVSLVAVKK